MANLLDLYTKTPDGNFKPKINKGFVGLFCGESGSGKDNALASFPKPIFVFDFDHRIAGMQSAVEWLGIDEMKQIEYEQFNLDTDIFAIDKRLDVMVAEAQARRFKYKTLYFASLTSIAHMGAYYNRVKNRGKKPGEPGDHLDAKLAYQFIRGMMYARIMPLQEAGINIIFAAHVVPKWGKKNPADTGAALDPNVVIGERILGLSQDFSEEIPGYFDNVVKFKKEIDLVGNASYKAEFIGDLAKTAFPINGTKSIDITNKSFYNELSQLISLAEYKGVSNGSK